MLGDLETNFDMFTYNNYSNESANCKHTGMEHKQAQAGQQQQKATGASFHQLMICSG